MFCVRSRSPPRSPRPHRSWSTRPRRSGCFFPAITTSMRRWFLSHPGNHLLGANWQGPFGHPPTPFANTHALGVPEWQTELAEVQAILRRRHRHGPRQPHLLSSVRLARQYTPTAVTAKLSNLEPDRWDTEDNFQRGSDLSQRSLRTRTSRGPRASAKSSTRSKAKKAQSRWMMIRSSWPSWSAPTDPRSPRARSRGAFTSKKLISSHWMDASHVSWFNSLFDQFRNPPSRARSGSAARRASPSSVSSSSRARIAPRRRIAAR